MAQERKVWSDKEIKILISMYEENTILWNVRSTDYKNRIKKQEILKLIANKFNTDSNEVTRKLHNLRSQFMQEVRKIKIKKSGSGTEEIFVSTWPYFQALKFIQSSVDNSNTTDNLTFNISERETSSQEPIPSTVVQESEPRPRSLQERKTSSKKRSCNTEPSEEVKKAINLLNQPMDDEQIFCDYIASEMREIKNPTNKRKLRHLINEAIMKISKIDAEESNNSSPSTSHTPSYTSVSRTGYDVDENQCIILTIPGCSSEEANVNIQQS